MTRVRHRSASIAPSRTDRGQALVEFALVAPFLFILLLGIIEAGRFIFFTEVLNSATRDGARYAIVHGADLEADKGCSSGPLPGDPSLNDPDSSDSCDPGGDLVQDAVRKASMNLAGMGAMFSVPSRLDQPRNGDPRTRRPEHRPQRTGQLRDGVP